MSGGAIRVSAKIVVETSYDAGCYVWSPGVQATANLVWIVRWSGAGCRVQAQHTGAAPKSIAWQNTSSLDCAVYAKL